jgi:hypothetical protein
MKLAGLVPNVHIHVSVSYLYIPRIGLPILIPESGHWERGCAASFLVIHKSDLLCSAGEKFMVNSKLLVLCNI